MTVTSPTFKWEWNLNTLAVLAGFMGGFVAWGYTLAEMRNGQSLNASNIIELKTEQAAVSARVDAIEKASAIQAQFEYRLAQIEKAQDVVDARISRITESYSNQFSDLRNQLGSISTQIALTNQTLNRIEASSTPIAPLK
jgi:hypothetical protein